VSFRDVLGGLRLEGGGGNGFSSRKVGEDESNLTCAYFSDGLKTPARKKDGEKEKDFQKPLAILGFHFKLQGCIP